MKVLILLTDYCMNYYGLHIHVQNVYEF